MKTATKQTPDLESLYTSTKEALRALTIERARRIAEDPDLYFQPGQRDRDLIGRIHALKREFTAIEAQYQSARGNYYFIGCYAGEHKKCKREITRDKARLVCGCPCHKTQGGNDE